MPRPDEPDPWWPHLVAAAADTPRVIARLPFGPRGNARSDGAEALTIGCGAQQETGRSHVAGGKSRRTSARAKYFRELLVRPGLACTFFAPYGMPASP